MYNYLVEYNALFALLYMFRKVSCFYNECSNWSLIELQEFIEGNLLSLLLMYVKRNFKGFIKYI